MVEVEKAMLLADMEDPNPMSTRDIGLFLFGGEQKTIKPVAQLDPVTGMPKRYQSGARKGQIVTKNEPIHKDITGLFHNEGARTESGQWAVSDPALKKFNHPIIDTLLLMRQVSKDISTYFKGYSDLVWRTTEDTGIIHHSLHHCSTGTGRLSSTKPNLQNVTTED